MEALEKDFQDLVTSEEQEILECVAEPIQEEPVAEEDTEEVLEEDEEITAEELESYNELIAILKEENPDFDFDNFEIVVSEDSEELEEIMVKKFKKMTSGAKAAARQAYAKLSQAVKDKRAKDRKKKRAALNKKLASEGRTAIQHKKWLAKQKDKPQRFGIRR